MNKLYKRIYVLLVFLFGATFNKDSKAANVHLENKDINDRINKIRTALNENIKTGNIIKIDGNDVLNKNLSEWVNWGNWSNWKNWNNWRDWNNWANWGNWRNY